MAERMNGILKQEYGLGGEFNFGAKPMRCERWTRVCGFITTGGCTRPSVIECQQRFISLD